MKPVYQTKFGDGEGNCFAACIASLLEIDIDSIPDFYQLYKNEWWLKFIEWIEPFGLTPIMLNDDPTNKLPIHNCYYLVGGMSPRGIGHSVIYLNGNLVHDPHPNGEGLSEIWDTIIFVRTFYP